MPTPVQLTVNPWLNSENIEHNARIYIQGVFGIVVMCACESSGSFLYMIGECGTEKHIFETESNSLNKR